jgi:hypothetical protein
MKPKSRKVVFKQVVQDDGTPIHTVLELFNTTRWKIGDTVKKDEIDILISEGVQVVIRP